MPAMDRQEISMVMLVTFMYLPSPPILLSSSVST